MLAQESASHLAAPGITRLLSDYPEVVVVWSVVVAFVVSVVVVSWVVVVVVDALVVAGAVVVVTGAVGVVADLEVV